MAATNLNSLLVVFVKSTLIKVTYSIFFPITVNLFKDFLSIDIPRLGTCL